MSFKLLALLAAFIAIPTFGSEVYELSVSNADGCGTDEAINGPACEYGLSSGFIETLEECADLCIADSNCLSFDYGKGARNWKCHGNTIDLAKMADEGDYRYIEQGDGGWDLYRITKGRGFQLSLTSDTWSNANTQCVNQFGTGSATIHTRGQFDNAYTACNFGRAQLGQTALLCCLGGQLTNGWTWLDGSDNTLLANTASKWDSHGLWASTEPSAGENIAVIHAQDNIPANIYGIHGHVDSQCYALCAGEQLECPQGSTVIGRQGEQNDIIGCGLDNCEARYVFNTIEECKNHCALNTNCIAFSWAPIGGEKNILDKNVCTTYATDVPNQYWGPNQIMCGFSGPYGANEAELMILRLKDSAMGFFPTDMRTNGGIVNVDNPEANAYSIIGNLNYENYRGVDGKFTFKLEYLPQNYVVIWKQSSWPANSDTIEGYEAIDVDDPLAGNVCTGFHGLGLSNFLPNAWMDGTGIGDCYWNSVGPFVRHVTGFPAFKEEDSTGETLYLITDTE
eukprot:435716_1